ncbi:hypothetical protein [Actinoplanes sp. N902-109]|uniref:hypothetical protein n=1 Tax=Actinoplanes sp. (strain N902-109) TaxID=649831 RepID=UPI0003295677|nr:hypothetical protein [Actinoplanes sp. N902-109]AGL16778.1 hypothetical protein L083_3268 [Actinoplanes sp. N902-109]
MRLTGIPLLLLAVAATTGAGAATVLLWPRHRFVLRAGGLLLTETLLVLSGGLAVNRHEVFYPSWRALAGDTGARAVIEPAAPGRLDAQVGDGADVVWQPAGSAAWHLAAPPRIVVPAGYARLPHARFPVILALVPAAGPAVAAARRIPGAITVVAVPGRHTTAAVLRDLPADLCRDVRATAQGWDLVAAGPQARLGRDLVRTQPPGFVVAHGWAPQQLAAPLAAPMRLPA